jgi:hypothetical protein
MIQEPFSDDVIRTPLKVESPALPGFPHLGHIEKPFIPAQIAKIS